MYNSKYVALAEIGEPSIVKIGGSPLQACSRFDTIERCRMLRCTSFMTGRRPDQTETWNFIDDFRVKRTATSEALNAPDAPEEIMTTNALLHAPLANGETDAPGAGANWSTMPQYFKEKGYQVYGTGKLLSPLM